MNPATDTWRPRPFEQTRAEAYAHLRGQGLEVGGFENPARPGPLCHVLNCDRISAQQAKALYPELRDRVLPEVDRIVDLDQAGLWLFEPGSQDFAICNHVLEHLVDPIRAVRELARVVRPGGHLVLTVPDLRFTFDREASPTPWLELRRRHLEGKRQPDALDYAPLAPRHADESEVEYLARLNLHLARREHLNAWTSDSFVEFLDETWRLLGKSPMLIHLSRGEQSNLECTTVWRLGSGFSASGN